MNYVDGFVCAVSTAKQQEYLQHASDASKLFKQCGALSVVETWGDDVPEGTLTSFSMAVQRKDDETVVFSWVTWPSREARDEGWKKVMADPSMQPGAATMPFDGKRMIYGGFKVILDV